VEAEARTLLDKGQITFKEYLSISSLPFKDTLVKSLNERENTDAAIQDLEMKNLVLRAKLDPESLSPEEVKILEELQREEATNELTQLQGE